MNAGIEQNIARGLSASNETRQVVAQWLRTTSTASVHDKRQMLLARYPAGLINDAELEALMRILDR
jgi:hypothetical protein